MRRFTQVLLPLVGCVAAFAAGAWFSIERPGEERLAASANVGLKTVSRNEPGFSSDEEMLTVIMSALSEGDPLLRAHELHNALSRLSSGEFGILFDKAVQIEDRDRRGTLLGVLLARWAIVDPTGAEAAVSPYLKRYRSSMRNDWRSADTAVCMAWAGALPERALAEALAAFGARWAIDTAGWAIDSSAERDPVRQLELLAQFPANWLRDSFCESAIKALAEKDCAAAEARLDLLSKPQRRASVQSEILGKLAERDPAAALARLAALAPNLKPGADNFRLVTAVLRAAAKKDPTAAFEAVKGLPERFKTEAFRLVFAGWAQGHLDDALAWAEATGGDQSGAKSSLSYIAFSIDRDKTLAWLRTQPASSERDVMLTGGIRSAPVVEKLQLYDELTPRAKAEAAAMLVRSCFEKSPSFPADQIEPWINAQPPGPARKGAIQAFAYHQTPTSENVEALANQWSSGPDRDAALRGICSSIYDKDPQRALVFARRIGAHEVRESALENIAQSWLYRDESAARAWITSTPELSTDEKRVILRQFDER